MKKFIFGIALMVSGALITLGALIGGGAVAGGFNASGGYWDIIDSNTANVFLFGGVIIFIIGLIVSLGSLNGEK